MVQSNLDRETVKSLIEYSLKKATEKSDHITRLAMYKHLTNKLAGFDSEEKKCLAISHSAGLGRLLGLKSIKYDSANYPEVNIMDLSLFQGYDFCVSDQVFEHIEGNPFLAFQETVNVLKPGGIVCHTTCFINHIHGVPKDFWRFTPDALALLSSASGCETLDCGGWGNREAWALIDLGFRFAKLPADEDHPLHKLAMKNERDWPIVTWIIAQKK